MDRRTPRASRTGLALVALGAAVVSATTPAWAQRLSAEEQRIIDYVDAHAEGAVALLERIVDINSGTMNPEGVRRVAGVLADELRAIGFETRWVALPDSLRRSGHLIAERRGGRGKRLLLIGHLDTVFEEDGEGLGFVREGERAKGPGVGDMKGGDVVIVQALKALHAAGALDGATIRVIFTGDEENPGEPLSVSRHDLIELAKQSDIALGFEGGTFGREFDYGVIARRSASEWTLEVRGTRAHSSGVFGAGVGAGAIFEAARILNEFYRELKGEEYLTFNPGAVVGGTEIDYDDQENRGSAFGKTNVVAEMVVVQGDIRTISGEQLERTRERMRQIVARSLPGTSARITFADGYPAMPPSDGNRALLGLLDQVSRDLGFGEVRPFDPGRRGAADVSFAAPYVDGLDGLGPDGAGSHTPDESLDLRTLPRATKRAALLIRRLTTANAGFRIDLRLGPGLRA